MLISFQFFNKSDTDSSHLNRVADQVLLGRRPMPNEWASIIRNAFNGKDLCEELAPVVKWSVVANDRAKLNESFSGVHDEELRAHHALCPIRLW